MLSWFERVNDLVPVPGIVFLIEAIANASCRAFLQPWPRSLSRPISRLRRPSPIFYRLGPDCSLRRLIRSRRRCMSIAWMCSITRCECASSVIVALRMLRSGGSIVLRMGSRRLRSRMLRPNRSLWPRLMISRRLLALRLWMGMRSLWTGMGSGSLSRSGLGFGSSVIYARDVLVGWFVDQPCISTPATRTDLFYTVNYVTLPSS